MTWPSLGCNGSIDFAVVRAVESPGLDRPRPIANPVLIGTVVTKEVETVDWVT